MNIRALAALVVTDVASRGQSLTEALANREVAVDTATDKALLQEMSYGVLRWWHQLAFYVNKLVSRPLKQKDADIRHLIMVGLYQLQEMRIPDHAAVSETVNACQQLNKQWARQLVNAVLRNYQRRGQEIQQAQLGDDAVIFSHPSWLIEQIKKAWPEYWQQILTANNQRPPMSLRINQQRTSRDEFRENLSADDIACVEFPYNGVGITLEKSRAVETIPGFGEGLISVQDGAAQLAAACLNVQPGQRVLDVCAAPGGKTAHILETYPGLKELIAVDIDKQRLQRIDENLQRLQLGATLVEGDAARAADWWNNTLFDRILVDAPCSATGVIRRHPDIKLLRKPGDIDKLVKLQASILSSVWPLLAPEGMLLYATCSILPQENEQQVRDFIESRDDVQVVLLQADWGLQCQYGRQVLTGQDNMDGFYYACLRKLK